MTIESIEFINDDQVLVICDDEDTAKRLIKRNPIATVESSEDGRFGLVYNAEDTNLLLAIRKK